MSVLGAALISFFSLMMLAWHLSPRTRRRIVGYAGWVDLCMHGTVIFLFMGTSTLGLMQAELSAIFITLFIRLYRWAKGYERISGGQWRRYAGALT